MAIRLTEQQANSKMLRERILLVADKLFHEYGYDKVSMREIAVASGVTTGALYHHFDSKQQILMAVFRQNLHSEELMEKYKSSTDPEEDLRDFLCERMPETVLRDGVELTRYRLFSITRFDRRSVLEACVETLVEQAVKQGLFTEQVPPEEISGFLCSIYRSAVYQYSVSANPIDLKALLRKQYHLALRAILKKRD